MKPAAKLFPVFFLTALLCTPASAAEVLWYTGHSGYDEGRTNLDAILVSEGAAVKASDAPALPDLESYVLVFVVLPGFFDPDDYFSRAEKARLAEWAGRDAHRLVLVSEWSGFYQGDAVLADLLAGIGQPLRFVPGGYDNGCGHCGGSLNAQSPLTADLGHLCYAMTATWDRATAIPLAFPEDATAPGPYVAGNTGPVPNIIGIADSNLLTDACAPGGLGGDADTREFVRRLYRSASPGVLPVEQRSWGSIKSLYR